MEHGLEPTVASGCSERNSTDLRSESCASCFTGSWTMSYSDGKTHFSSENEKKEKRGNTVKLEGGDGICHYSRQNGTDEGRVGPQKRAFCHRSVLVIFHRNKRSVAAPWSARVPSFFRGRVCVVTCWPVVCSSCSEVSVSVRGTSS